MQTILTQAKQNKSLQMGSLTWNETRQQNALQNSDTFI